MLNFDYSNLYISYLYETYLPANLIPPVKNLNSLDLDYYITEKWR